MKTVNLMNNRISDGLSSIASTANTSNDNDDHYVRFKNTAKPEAGEAIDLKDDEFCKVRATVID